LRTNDHSLLTTSLDDFGSIKLIGLGGVGGIVARFLLMYLAASGRPARVVLIDGDAFEARNAERMSFSQFGNKAAVVREDLLELVEESLVSLSTIETFVEPDNIARLLHPGDTVLLAVDNHATRQLVGDYCREHLDEVCLISGGNDGVGDDTSGVSLRGSYGNVQIYRREEGRDLSPHLGAFHPEIAAPNDQLPTELSCSEALFSTPQILFANLATASAMLNAFLLHVCGALDYQEVCFDIAEGLMRPLQLPVPRA
jgi:hypothetical protein